MDDKIFNELVSNCEEAIKMEASRDVTVSELLVILKDLEVRGFGDYEMEIMGEYSVTNQYEIKGDIMTVDFYGHG